MNDPLRVVLVDDHRVIRDGLRAILLGHPIYKVVGSVGSASEFYAGFSAFNPQLCLLDVHLSDSSGMDIAKWIKEHHSGIKILIMTALHDRQVLSHCRSLGIEGIISKESGKETILAALDAIRSGRSFYGGEFTDMLFSQGGETSILSEREKDFVRAFARGWSQKEIADYLHISPRTVEVHKKHVLDKLGINNSVDLIKYAIKEGLSSLD